MPTGADGNGPPGRRFRRRRRERVGIELGEGRCEAAEVTRNAFRPHHPADPHRQATGNDVGGLQPPTEESEQVDRAAHVVGLDAPLGRASLAHQAEILELEDAESGRARRTPADLHALGPAVGESLREVEIEQETCRHEVRRGEDQREQEAGDRQPAENTREGPVHSRESLACESLAPMGVMERIGTIVVGGGVVGAAVADSLARRGDDVLLVERHSPGHSKGSSNGDGRIFRYSYPEADYVRLAALAERGLARPRGESR